MTTTTMTFIFIGVALIVIGLIGRLRIRDGIAGVSDYRNSTKRFLNKYLYYVPVLSTIPHCKPKDFLEASKELGVILLMSTMPIWLGAWLMKTGSTEQSGFISLLFNNIKQEELFIYAATTIAPVIYLLSIEVPTNRPGHPSRLSYYICVLAVIVLSATAYGKLKSLSSIADAAFTWYAAWTLFFISIFVLFLATAFKNSYLVEMDPEEFKKQEAKAIAGYSQRRKNLNG